MDMKRLIHVGLLLVLLIILVIIFFRTGGEERIKPASSTTFPEQEPLSEEPEETTQITLFFPSEEDTLLHPEVRDIIASSSVGIQAKQVIEELIKGSQNGYISAVPPETKLRELFITEEGVAYVDFSREIQEKHNSGSSAEISTIFSIVNSLTYNFKSVKKVFILIDGGEKQTLGGHIDLSRPFLPQHDLIAN